MRIIGCDLHARQQTLAMLDTETGEVVNLTLEHDDDNVWEAKQQWCLPVPLRPCECLPDHYPPDLHSGIGTPTDHFFRRPYRHVQLKVQVAQGR